MFDRGLGLVSAGPAGRENLLSLIPCLIERVLHVCVVSVGVAGWNTSAAWFEHVPVFVGRRLGTLLGPEETSCVWVLFSGPLLVRLS